jgi:hypothetical protein
VKKPHYVGDNCCLDQSAVGEYESDGHENSARVKLPALIAFDVSSTERTEEFVDFFFVHFVLEDSYRPLATKQSDNCLKNERVQ